MTVVMDRDGGNLAQTRRLGLARFETPCAARSSDAVTSGLLADRAPLFTALTDTAGVVAHRQGAFERIGWILTDWDSARTFGRHRGPDGRRAQGAEPDRACHQHDGLSRSARRPSSPRPATSHRFTSARAVVKHAGLAPRERTSGTFAGKARLSGAGRPALRTAAWRAGWGCLQNNRVYAAHYRHLTSRDTNRLKPTQAQTVIAAAILRQLYAVVTHEQAWDPHIAAHGLPKRNAMIAA
jgi:hypothetical protein